MAARQTKAMREQSLSDLMERLKQVDRELFALRNEKALKRRLEKPHRIPALRKEKARLLTIEMEKRRIAQ